MPTVVPQDGVLWVPTKSQWEFPDGTAVTMESIVSGALTTEKFDTIIQTGHKSGKAAILDDLIDKYATPAFIQPPPATPYSFNDFQTAFRAQQRIAFSQPTATFSTTTNTAVDAEPEPLYHEDPEAEVRFSEHAPVTFKRLFGTEEVTCSPFQRNSYTARVEFLEDGITVAVALPSAARTKKQEEWVPEVVAFANGLACLGEEAGAMPDG